MFSTTTIMETLLMKIKLPVNKKLASCDDTHAVLAFRLCIQLKPHRSEHLKASGYSGTTTQDQL